MTARLLLAGTVAVLALMLAACDGSPSEQGICLIGDSGEGRFSGRVLAPAYGDTLRVGRPFVFRAEVAADSNVKEIGAVLVASARDSLGRLEVDTLFVEPLTTKPGRYTLERTIELGALTAPLPVDGRPLSLGVYGVMGFEDCGGGVTQAAVFTGVVIEP